MNEQRNVARFRTALPGMHHIEKAFRNASFAERFIAGTLAVIFAGSTLALLFELNGAISSTVPTYGGTLNEGIVGAPRFINPLLAVSDADRDLTELVYAGLLSATPEGTFRKELAKEYTVSEDGRRYTFILRDDATFHDGTPVTADDVVFTVLKAQDSMLKSPKRANWEGVGVQKIDPHTVQFILNEPYALFLENATLGILPKHLWESVTSEQFSFSNFNLEPIGAGPYKIEKIRRDAAGIPQTYELIAWSNYALGRPYIKKLHLHFFPNEEQLEVAYQKGDVEALSAIPPSFAKELETEQDVRIEQHPLPRVFAAFFNQNQNTLFTHREVRRALQESVAIEELIESVLLGYGTPAYGPLPPREDEHTPLEGESEVAHTLLLDAGWKQGSDGIYEKGGERLRFTLRTANTPELKETALFLKNAWRELGADVTVEFFDIGTLNQEIIRPRNFDVLLFGQILGRTPDPFAFWHSSQRNDPGLNIATYANITVDDIVEDIRTEGDIRVRDNLYSRFVSEVLDDQPAVFLYAPDFIYVVPEELAGATLGTVTTPSERFLDVHTWYLETDTLWNLFVR